MTRADRPRAANRLSHGRLSRFRLAAPVAALLVAGLLVSCTGEWSAGRTGAEPPPAEPAPVGEPADWRPCPELLDELFGDIAPPGLIDQLTEQVSYECASVAVPQDWDDPQVEGDHEIAMVRARSARQTERIGSLLVNPGGPGASGIETAVVLSLGPMLGGLPSRVTDRFDLVGFDPRGVGRSSPVECFTDQELDESFGADPDPVTRSDFQAAADAVGRQARTCQAKYGAALDTYSTRQTAHDLEALRTAVGDDQLTYLGFSYGTLLGATYAQLYPDQIRAMVLDGAVDPHQDMIESTEAQAVGFERAMDNFTDWCEANGDNCPLEPDARTAVTDAIADARRSPTPGEHGRSATAGWVFWSVVATLYSRELWPQLAGALEQLAAGDPGEVFALADSYTRRGADGSYPNIFDANAAVNCADSDIDISVPEVRRLQEQWREQYPLFGAPLALGLLSCAVWPVEPDPYPTGAAEGAPPILVVGTRGDPATPYESTAVLAEMLQVGVVVTWEGEGHTAYPGTTCVNDVVDAYLVDLTVPERDPACPPE